MAKRKIILIVLLLLIFSLGFFSRPNTTKADNATWPGWEVDYPGNPPQEPSLPQYVNYIYNIAFFVAGFLAVVMIIIGGLQWMSSAASPQQKMAAKNKITRSVLGLVTLFAIFVVLKAINPDILVLKELAVSEASPSYNYELNLGTPDIILKIKKELKARYVRDYDSATDTLPNEASEPCECAGTEGGEDARCGTYCFHACRRYLAKTKGTNEINPHVYGILRDCDMGAGLDKVSCACYESTDENITVSQVTTVEFANGCELNGDETPPCRDENKEFCYDYCTREGWKAGYISRWKDTIGRGLDLVWCTCFK